MLHRGATKPGSPRPQEGTKIKAVLPFEGKGCSLILIHDRYDDDDLSPCCCTCDVGRPMCSLVRSSARRKSVKPWRHWRPRIRRQGVAAAVKVKGVHWLCIGFACHLDSGKEFGPGFWVFTLSRIRVKLCVGLKCGALNNTRHCLTTMCGLKCLRKSRESAFRLRQYHSTCTNPDQEQSLGYSEFQNDARRHSARHARRHFQHLRQLQKELEKLEEDQSDNDFWQRQPSVCRDV